MENRTARPYRVLLVDLANGYGGPETRVASEAAALQGLVEHCAVAVTQGSLLHKALREKGIPCEPISASRTNPLIALELARVIRAGRYDLVDAHNIQSIFWGHLASLSTAARRVTTVHTDYGNEYTGFRRVLYSSLFALVRPVTDSFIHVTEVNGPGGTSGRRDRRAYFIPNAVPITQAPSVDVRAVRSALGFGADDFVVAVVGRFHEVKGQRYAIEAMAYLRDLPQVKLHLIGDGPLRQSLEAQVDALDLGDRISFAGFRPDVMDILPAHDCVCLPSVWELMPYAALEGAACARPIVATAVGGVPRIFADDRTAMLVPPEDPSAIAGAIRWLVENPEQARALGASAFDMVKESFSLDSMIARTLAVYDAVLVGANGPGLDREA